MVVKFSAASYYSDFFVYPPFIVGLAAVGLGGTTPVRLLHWALLCVLGVMLWTLLEYVFHRFVFHRVPVIADMHELHHKRPGDLVGTPSYVSLGVGVFGILAPLWFVAGREVATSITGGLALGYLWYVSIHHAIHHWRVRHVVYLYRGRGHHSLHHANPAVNFGVTTALWDRVFGTMKDPETRR
jgi:sterol desaturase/sphingolipid hydroxylase (fatty acid hydroxylase superfamily)